MVAKVTNGGVFVGEIELLVDVLLGLVDQENGGADARDGVAFSEGLALGGLAVEFLGVGGLVGSETVVGVDAQD